MSIDVNALSSCWRRAVETTTPVVRALPDGVRALLVYHDDGLEVRWVGDARSLLTTVVAYHVITNGVVGPRVERPAPVVTRRWETVPPNDDAPVICKYEQGGPAIRYGSDIQTPGPFVAYALFSDLLTAPPASVVPLDEADCYAWNLVDGFSDAEMRDFLNARLRAKRPTPVVVTARQAENALAEIGHTVPATVYQAYERIAASLTRQLAGGQP